MEIYELNGENVKKTGRLIACWSPVYRDKDWKNVQVVLWWKRVYK